jgi:hypothetical protein
MYKLMGMEILKVVRDYCKERIVFVATVQSYDIAPVLYLPEVVKGTLSRENCTAL